MRSDVEAWNKGDFKTDRMRQGMADARATISGFVEALTDSEQAAAARSTFREKYPDSFWVDFGALRCMHIGSFDER